MRLVFAGTPRAALPSLDALLASPRHQVVAVLTRPDAPAGRGRRVERSPVAAVADEHGIAVAKDPVHVHDFHATILHLMGLDHERLTFRHAGRDFRLTDVEGNVVRQILS